jgi:putative nucleotidyltransferase with HDIG domain
MTILFVDDEKQVLRGIERMLDAADFEGDTEFVGGVDEALEMLADDETIDTIVTDMRMPGMDGAELLNCVSEKYPHVVRIVLSGQADRDAVFRAIKPMHQYLSKPCEPEVLAETIRRASALRDVMQSETLANFIGGMANLPSVPAVYQQLVNATASDDVAVEDIGDIIAQDIAMTAKVLQLANSAVFGLRHPVTSASRAAVVLGVETLKTLVLSVGVFQKFEGQACAGFSIDGLMKHSLCVANASRKLAIAEKLDREFVDLAFTAGILHDIGKLALFASDPKKFEAACKESAENQTHSTESEMAMFGADHASVGAHVLGMWGVPQAVVEVVALHHRPGTAGETEFSILTAVTAANEIASQRQAGLTRADQSMGAYVDSVGCLAKVESWSNLIVEA